MSLIGFLADEARGATGVVPFDFLHGFVTGSTGSGKTATVIRPTLKDRIERGNAVVVYAYKGHEHRYVKHIAFKAGRLEDVVEIGKPHGVYINLLDTLDGRSLQKILHAANRSNDPYWSNSAARWAVAIVDVLNAIYNIEKWLVERGLHEIKSVIHDDRIIFGEKPSFKELKKIVNNPKSFKRFLAGLGLLEFRLGEMVKNGFPQTMGMGCGLPPGKEIGALDDEDLRYELAIKVMRFKNARGAISGITIDVDSESGAGNNGVLEVLYNAIVDLARKEFVNESEENLLEMIDRRKIIIVDIESLSTDIHSILLDSLLEKLSLRVRNGDPVPVTIIVDEANRVFPSDTDIHNDVLRESNNELILAFQNEEQMIRKFGEVGWDAAKENFLHKYHISQDHKISYGYGPGKAAEPYIADKEDLDKAEEHFNLLEANLNRLKERFYIRGKLPESFSINYHIKEFEESATVDIVSKETKEAIKAEYLTQKEREEIEKELDESIRLKRDRHM
ncbi:hypothetical protein [Hydrogenimonas sp.]